MADGNYTQFPIPYTVVDIEQMQSDLDTAEQNITNLGTSKQDKLTAGNGITLNGANISTDNDTALNSATKPAQGKAVGDALALKADKTYVNDELAEKANVNGTYPSLTAGLAEQLLSKNRVVDQTPYLYRQTALGKANATRALMKKIVGGSVVWNQLCNGSSVIVPSGHKYAAKIGGSWSVSASTGTAITGLTAGTDMVTDLTAMFGSTIADYIYGLETATAGSGIAKLREWGFFGEDYYDYDPGTMRSVEGVSAKETVGFNLFDKSLATVGKRIDNNGNIINQSATQPSALSDYIRVLPNHSYYLKNVHGIGFFYTSAVFDSNKNFIGILNVSGAFLASGIVTIPANGRFLRVNFHGNYVDSASCNLSDPQRNGEYEPYVKHTYPLDSSLTLRGIPKLDASNSLYYDGDEYAADGTVPRKEKQIVLDGSESWTRDSNTVSWHRYYIQDNSLKRLLNYRSELVATVPILQGHAPDAVSNPAPVSISLYSAGPGTKQGQNWIYLLCPINQGIDTVDKLKTYLASNPITAVIPLATPTTETAEPYTEVQVVDKDGTEEFVTSGIVPVGHVTEYPYDNSGKLDDIPDLPETAGSYVLKVTVTSGKASYEWVSAS